MNFPALFGTRTRIFFNSHRVFVLLSLFSTLVLSAFIGITFFFPNLPLAGFFHSDSKQGGTSQLLEVMEESCGVGNTSEGRSILLSGTVSKISEREKSIEIACRSGALFKISTDEETKFAVANLDMFKSGSASSRKLLTTETETSFYEMLTLGRTVQVNISREVLPVVANSATLIPD